MDNNIFGSEVDKKQSLDAWATDIFKPILSAVGAISLALESLYQELK